MKKIIIPAFCALSILGTASLGMAGISTFNYDKKPSLAEDPMSLTSRVYTDIMLDDTRYHGVF